MKPTPTPAAWGYGSGNAGFFKSLLNDHPDTPKRIERIRKYLETH